jgi:hypothetical protein
MFGRTQEIAQQKTHWEITEKLIILQFLFLSYLEGATEWSKNISKSENIIHAFLGSEGYGIVVSLRRL